MERKLIRCFGKILMLASACIGGSARAMSQCTSTLISNTGVFYKTCDNYVERNGCYMYIDSYLSGGGYTGSGEWITSPCTGYRNGSGWVCDIGTGASVTDCQSMYQYTFSDVTYWSVGIFQLFVNKTLVFDKCDKGYYVASTPSTGSYNNTSDMTGLCKPCSGLGTSGNSIVTFSCLGTIGTGSTTGLLAKCLNATASGFYWTAGTGGVGITQCIGYSSGDLTDDNGTFSASCPYSNTVL
ncbi:MAG: hypothetical protein LBK26_01785 [Rickettsiales bacterium]|jgi:hypothetical protein|nr:hypothetical protein [Rickettsiales bacterium]